MAAYGRSVSLLRQIQTILNEQLGGIDLYALRLETMGGNSDPRTTIAQNAANATSVATRWRDVLAAVSPSIVAYGLELRSALDGLAERTSSIVVMARIIWALEFMIVLLVSLTIQKTLQQSAADSATDLAGLATSLGAIAAFALLLLALFGAWNTKINEMHRQVAFMQASPLVTVLAGYSNQLCAKQIVAVMAAVATGGSVAEALAAYSASPISAGDPYLSGTAGACASQAGAPRQGVSDVGCGGGFDPCNAAAYTMAYMVPALQSGVCVGALVDIADALIDLKQNGVDRYDEAALWDGVRAGVDAVSALIETSRDAGDPARMLTRDTARDAIQQQVLPVLQLGVVELQGQFAPTGLVLGAGAAHIGIDPGRMGGSAAGMAAYNMWNPAIEAAQTRPRGSTDPGTPLTPPQYAMAPAQCTRTCLAAANDARGPSAVLSYYDAAAQLCYVSPRYDALASGAFVFTGAQSAGTSARSSGPAGGTMAVVRPSDFSASAVASAYAPTTTTSSSSQTFDALVDSAPTSLTALTLTGLAASAKSTVPPADGDFASFFAPKVPSTVTDVSAAATLAVKTTAGMLFAYALRSPGAAARTVRNQASDLAQRLYVVVKQFRFALDLDALRPLIDAGLADWYGADLYVNAGVSAEVDGVMHRLRALIAAGRRAAEPRFVAPQRLQAKLLAMSADDVTDLSGALQTMSADAASHRDLFPAYRSLSASRIAGIVSVLGGLVLLTGFVSYAFVLLGAYSQHRATSFEGLAMRMVVALCVLVIAVFVSETLALKVAARIEHNQKAIDDNGQMLVASAASSSAQLGTVLSLLGKQPDAPSSLGSDPASTQASVAALLAVGEQVVRKYEVCNSITSGQVGMPLPLPEIALYCIVGGTFLVLAAVAIARIAPLEKLASIRSLLGLRARLMRGDVGALAEAQQAVVCARPPVFVWQFFVWFGVLLLVTATSWFALASTDVVHEYRTSLNMVPGCE